MSLMMNIDLSYNINSVSTSLSTKSVRKIKNKHGFNQKNCNENDEVQLSSRYILKKELKVFADELHFKCKMKN